MRRLFIKLQNAIALREHKDEGATMVEYGLMVSLIAIAAVGVVTALGGKLNGVFTSIGNTL